MPVLDAQVEKIADYVFSGMVSYQPGPYDEDQIVELTVSEDQAEAVYCRVIEKSVADHMSIDSDAPYCFSCSEPNAKLRSSYTVLCAECCCPSDLFPGELG